MSHKSQDSSSFRALSRHDEYYIQGGDLFFLVEQVQFRVHRYFFERESSFFRGQLETPASPGASRQGTDSTSAIVLEEVTPSNFARFLWVFYNPKYSIYRAPVDHWTVILSLAHRWKFPEVKKLAVRELETKTTEDFPDIDRIVVYHDNSVDRNLLIPRYAALCEREEPLTLPEGMRLGMETTLMIARAREYARSNITSSGARSPSASNVHGGELQKIVRELFGVTASSEEPEEPVVAATSGPAPTSPGGLVTLSYPASIHG
ncbi:hypothetical protein BDQ12DRAFT_595172 [Crucibulum laeve]|uniref:BTB domain-containing protein n=1 Tax=Crucibulum laeve TaxID=68775 RepID=A0A5C3MLA7_9AGAR|nr:hypothetical protein BDQ12DRAFT_595172 [Crucibulum laeve]